MKRRYQSPSRLRGSTAPPFAQDACADSTGSAPSPRRSLSRRLVSIGRSRNSRTMEPTTACFRKSQASLAVGSTLLPLPFLTPAVGSPTPPCSSGPHSSGWPLHSLLPSLLHENGTA